jgi:hypothetical protein
MLLQKLAAAALLGIAFGMAPATAEEPLPGIPIVGMPLAAWVAARPHTPPNTLQNFETSPDRTARFGGLLKALLNHEWPQAVLQAGSLTYSLVTIREGDNLFVIASDDSGPGRDPTVIINVKPQLDLIVGAPHEPFERGTGEEAAILLRDLGGRAAIIAGAHRCASRNFSLCDGKTEVCGGASQGYRDSDAGHNIATLYHAAHVQLAERWPSSIVMSLHGMKEDTEGVRTSVIISNGIRADDSAQRTMATRFRAALGGSITQPGAVVSCNLSADAVFEHRKLCGYTNVQGRHVNRDADACRSDVDQGSGRFIHIEQDWTVLQPYVQGRLDNHPYNDAFVRALALVLPAAAKP